MGVVADTEAMTLAEHASETIVLDEEPRFLVDADFFDAEADVWEGGLEDDEPIWDEYLDGNPL